MVGPWYSHEGCGGGVVVGRSGGAVGGAVRCEWAGAGTAARAGADREQSSSRHGNDIPTTSQAPRRPAIAIYKSSAAHVVGAFLSGRRTDQMASEGVGSHLLAGV